MIEAYDIIEADGLAQLRERINDAIDEGFQPTESDIIVRGNTFAKEVVALENLALSVSDRAKRGRKRRKKIKDRSRDLV